MTDYIRDFRRTRGSGGRRRGSPRRSFLCLSLKGGQDKLVTRVCDVPGQHSQRNRDGKVRGEREASKLRPDFRWFGLLLVMWPGAVTPAWAQTSFL